MINFLMGIVFSIVIYGISSTIKELVNKKQKKSQDIASRWYYICDLLWCKSSKYEPIRFYVGSTVDLWVEKSHIESSNRDLVIYKVHINNKECACATVVKINDGDTSYYSFYVKDKYEEEEIFKLLNDAKTALEVRKVHDSKKISVLDDESK